MRIEGGQFVPERDLKGFKTDPNTAVNDLETTLGITFPVRPEAVILTGRNKFVYAIKNGIVPSIAKTLLRRNNDAIGMYDYRYHAYFADKKTDLFTALHENMHGFNALVNSDILRQQELISQAVAERFVGRPLTQLDIEKVIVFKSFDEGMAQWAAIEAASLLGGKFDPKDLNSTRNLLLRGKETPDAVQIDEQFIDEEFQKLEEAKELYTQALQLTGIKVMTEGAKAEAVIQDVKYITGYYFVYLAALKLKREGVSTSDIITNLVKNPPSKINELRNPTTISIP